MLRARGQGLFNIIVCNNVFHLLNHLRFLLFFSVQASTAHSCYVFLWLKRSLGLVQWCTSPNNQSTSQFHSNQKVVKACLGFISSLTEMQNSKGDLWEHLSLATAISTAPHSLQLNKRNLRKLSKKHLSWSYVVTFTVQSLICYHFVVSRLSGVSITYFYTSKVFWDLEALMNLSL